MITCGRFSLPSTQDLCEMIRVLADDQQLSANILAAAAALETKPNATHAHAGNGEQSSAHETVDAQTVLWQARAFLRQLSDRPKLYPAGAIVHFGTTHGTNTAAANPAHTYTDGPEAGVGVGRHAWYTDQAHFDQLILSGAMFKVHLPNSYLDTIQTHVSEMLLDETGPGRAPDASSDWDVPSEWDVDIGDDDGPGAHETVTTTDTPGELYDAAVSASAFGAEDAPKLGEFDWLIDYQQLEALVLEHAPAADPLRDRDSVRVAVLGCGTSTLSESLWCAGWREVWSNDYDEGCITHMRARHVGCPGMRWDVADLSVPCRDALPDDSFDMVFDKGTFDAMLCEGTLAKGECE